MNAIEILNRCRDASADVRRLNDRLGRLKECAVGTTARYGSAGGGAGTSGDRVSTFAVEIAACEREIDGRTKAHEVELLAACKIADMLPEAECSILYRYYIQGQTLGGIARALHFSLSYVKRKKIDGLKLVEAIPQEDIDALLPDWYAARNFPSVNHECTMSVP